ncbi:septum formation initiator family protein [Patescibacteria group bacterium]|nr:septum formation initiator family protein [Patescibacteria group bacterium]
MNTKRRIIRFFIIIVSVVSVVSLSGSIVDLWQKRSILRERESEVSTLQHEQKSLNKQLQDAQSPEYIEREARNRLGLAKPGETVVLLPNGGTQAMTSPQQGKTGGASPHWREWWKLFF